MFFWGEISETVRHYLPRFAYFRRHQPISDFESVSEFARTRAAFVCQKKLYGYVKTRVGIRFPKMMDDELFVRSLNTAKMELYAACLADMTCFCISLALAGGPADPERKAELARGCFARGIEENDDGSCGADAPARWRQAFEERLKKTVWYENGPAHFSESPKALVRWAPIAENLKALDAEIVENSIANAWIEVRKEFADRLDRAAVMASLDS